MEEDNDILPNSTNVPLLISVDDEWLIDTNTGKKKSVNKLRRQSLDKKTEKAQVHIEDELSEDECNHRLTKSKIQTVVYKEIEKSQQEKIDVDKLKKYLSMLPNYASRIEAVERLFNENQVNVNKDLSKSSIAFLKNTFIRLHVSAICHGEYSDLPEGVLEKPITTFKLPKRFKPPMWSIIQFLYPSWVVFRVFPFLYTGTLLSCIKSVINGAQTPGGEEPPWARHQIQRLVDKIQQIPKKINELDTEINKFSNFVGNMFLDENKKDVLRNAQRLQDLHYSIKAKIELLRVDLTLSKDQEDELNQREKYVENIFNDAIKKIRKRKSYHSDVAFCNKHRTFALSKLNPDEVNFLLKEEEFRDDIHPISGDFTWQLARLNSKNITYKQCNFRNRDIRELKVMLANSDNDEAKAIGERLCFNPEASQVGLENRSAPKSIYETEANLFSKYIMRDKIDVDKLKNYLSTFPNFETKMKAIEIIFVENKDKKLSKNIRHNIKLLQDMFIKLYIGAILHEEEIEFKEIIDKSPVVNFYKTDPWRDRFASRVNGRGVSNTAELCWYLHSLTYMKDSEDRNKRLNCPFTSPTFMEEFKDNSKFLSEYVREGIAGIKIGDFIYEARKKQQEIKEVDSEVKLYEVVSDKVASLSFVTSNLNSKEEKEVYLLRNAQHILYNKIKAKIGQLRGDLSLSASQENRLNRHEKKVDNIFNEAINESRKFKSPKVQEREENASKALFRSQKQPLLGQDYKVYSNGSKYKNHTFFTTSDNTDINPSEREKARDVFDNVIGPKLFNKAH